MVATMAEVLTGIAPWAVDRTDCLAGLRAMPAGVAQCCCTSPPYYSLRSYLPDGHPDKALEVGLQKTPAEYVAMLVEVFRDVRRVLRPDGVLWLNLGDSYASHAGGNAAGRSRSSTLGGAKREVVPGSAGVPIGLKPKDLIGIPWQVAFALREDGWYLRSECIWSKASPMPQSVRDRPTTSHEHVFLFAKRPAYFYDQDAERVAVAEASVARVRPGSSPQLDKAQAGRPGLAANTMSNAQAFNPQGRNLWTVWDIPPEALDEPHFAAYPSSLPRRCIKLGTSASGCCPACGAPWRRLVERSRLTRQRPNDLTKRTGEAGTGNHCGNTVAGVAVTTSGWEPTCACTPADPTGCLVLDPFTGSGTTGMVARELGRRFVGFELNEEYAQMARRRIGSVNPLLDACDRAAAPLVVAQRDLFMEAP